MPYGINLMPSCARISSHSTVSPENRCVINYENWIIELVSQLENWIEILKKYAGFICCRWSPNLLEKVQEKPWKVLEFQIKLNFVH